MSNPLTEQVCFAMNSAPSSSSLLVKLNSPPPFPEPPAPVVPPPLLLLEVPPPVPVSEVDPDELLELLELELLELELLELEPLELEPLELELELLELFEAEVDAAVLGVPVVAPVVALVEEGVPDVLGSSASEPESLHWDSTNGRLATPNGTRNDFKLMMRCYCSTEACGPIVLGTPQQIRRENTGSLDKRPLIRPWL